LHYTYMSGLTEAKHKRLTHLTGGRLHPVSERIHWQRPHMAFAYHIKGKEVHKRPIELY